MSTDISRGLALVSGSTQLYTLTQIMGDFFYIMGINNENKNDNEASITQN